VAEGDIDPGGRYVLYWMTAARRATHNFALDRALELALDLGRPLVILEPLRCGYAWASDRHHRFVLQGMADNRRAFAGTSVLYHPYVEPAVGHGKGLLARLAQDACAVVADESPAFFLPRMVEAARAQVPVRFERVDSVGLLPLRAADRVFSTAYAFRRFLQRELKIHLGQRPSADPLESLALPALASLPEEVTTRWPAAGDELLAAEPDALARLPLDHEVGPAPLDGGARAGLATLLSFVEQRLPRYAEGRNQPTDDASSHLSPYLHFGHVSPHQVLELLAAREDWSHEALPDGGSGARAGWWGMSPEAEGFLDELVTWRELGHVTAHLRPDCERYESLPAWAQQTLDDHADDPREHLYDLDALEHACTHDELWNAAQRELVRTGRMHNYLRMLWGKKILEWSASPRHALAYMLELNNKYALDGRDPNSTSGITWVLGRYDRAWGPERPIFGKIRYMSSKNTARKLRVREYLARWTAPSLIESA
jgi:deoxyribodipyrimidine photo-lyase